MQALATAARERVADSHGSRTLRVPRTRVSSGPVKSSPIAHDPLDIPQDHSRFQRNHNDPCERMDRFQQFDPLAGATPPPQPVASRSPAAVALHKSRSLPGGCPSLGHRIRPAVTPRIRGRGSKYSATKIGDPPVAAVHIPKDTRAAGNSSHVAVAKSPRQLTQRPETSELTGLEIGLRSVRFHRPESRKNVPLSNPIPSAI